MAVYYRYKSGVDTFSVPVSAPSISVADLKRLILATPRHGHGRTRGRGQRETVALSDAQTGEEYTDDGALVPRSSTVLVRRVAGPPAETIALAPSPPPPKAAGSSSSVEDDEDRAISAVVDAAQLEWEDPRPCHGARLFGHGGAAVGWTPPPPPPGYVCHRCRVPGHFIQHCPTNGDPRYDLGRAPATTTTLPAATAPSVSATPDDGIPAELHCKICKKAMADAVVAARCCFGSFCDGCIRGHIAGKSKCVCGAQARADDLIPNLTLRATIANLLATRAAASRSGGGTEKPRSSSGSNTEPALQEESRRSHVTAAAATSEHSDESTSSRSKSKSAPAPAAREPRSKQTTAESAQAIAMAHPGYPEQYYGYGGPSVPSCYDPFFGGAVVPWAADPYACYGVPYGGGYPTGPVPPSYNDGGRRRKRAAGDERRHQEAGFKRRCGADHLSPFDEPS